MVVVVAAVEKYLGEKTWVKARVPMREKKLDSIFVLSILHFDCIMQTRERKI